MVTAARRDGQLSVNALPLLDPQPHAMHGLPQGLLGQQAPPPCNTQPITDTESHTSYILRTMYTAQVYISYIFERFFFAY